MSAFLFQTCRLNDWFVALARATSFELGMEACQAYAHQLTKEDDIVKGRNGPSVPHELQPSDR